MANPNLKPPKPEEVKAARENIKVIAGHSNSALNGFLALLEDEYENLKLAVGAVTEKGRKSGIRDGRKAALAMIKICKKLREELLGIQREAKAYQHQIRA